MDRKEIKLSTLFKLLRKQKPFWILGIIFCSITLFIFTPLIICLSFLLKEPYESYDYNKILREGKVTIAKVTEIRSVQNVTINDQHPQIIKYIYNDNDRIISDNFKTIQNNTLKIGDQIEISTLNNQSIIKGLEQFSLPFKFFLIAPILFFILGLITLALAFIAAYKEFRLYKYGRLADATIHAITRSSGLPITNYGEKVIIDYSFNATNGVRLMGKSSTTDFSILAKYNVGSNIKIFYSDIDMSKNCIVPTELINTVR